MVITGWALAEDSRIIEDGFDTTLVVMRVVDPEEAAAYAASGEPLDKAGAYAIQGRGAFMVATINGSFTNVVGLPMAETVDLLEQAGLTSWPADAADGEAADA